MLRRFCAGSCTLDDTSVVDALVVTSSDDLDFAAEPWISAPLLAMSDSVRDIWNFFATARFKAHNGCAVYTCMSGDTILGAGLTPAQQLLVDELSISSTARLPRSLRLAVGMPVIVPLQYTCVLGCVQRIRLDSREPVNPVLDALTGDVVLQYPPVAVVCKAREDGEIFQVEPSVAEFPFDGRLVRRTQFKIVAAFAMTFADARGRTFDHLIVDPATPPGSRITFQDIYLAFSRVASLDYS